MTSAEIREFARQADRALPDGWRDVEVSRWEHMGAIIGDTGLQAGLRYDTVVLPRVARLAAFYPTARTTRGFIAAAKVVGMGNLLHWSHTTKLQRIDAMAGLLLQHDVDTAADLRHWLDTQSSRSTLFQIHGVGPKTVDYLRKLAGLEAIAVDRHLRSFASAIGAPRMSYDGLVDLYLSIARELGVQPSSLDDAIWSHFRQTGSS